MDVKNQLSLTLIAVAAFNSLLTLAAPAAPPSSPSPQQPTADVKELPRRSRTVVNSGAAKTPTKRARTSAKASGRLVPTGHYAVIQPADSNRVIPELQFLNAKKIKTFVRVRGGEAEFLGVLYGKMEKKGYNIAWDPDLTSAVSAKPQKGFLRAVMISGSDSPVEILVVGPKGETLRERFLISFEKYDDALAAATKKPKKTPSNLTASVGLGATTSTYKQSRIDDFTQISTTAKVAVLYGLNPRWDIGANVFVTALPISSNITDTTARYLGANFRVGYTPSWLKAPWGLSLLAGAYYTSMYVSSTHVDPDTNELVQFGYRNLAGPQMFPTVRYSFANGNTGYVYFKFSPVSDGASLLALSNREIAAGTGYAIKLGNGHPLTISFDYANLFFESLTAAGSNLVESTSMSLGVSYGF